MNESKGDPFVDWLQEREDSMRNERIWWQRGATVTALLFLLNTFIITGLWLIGLADALPACLVSGASFIIAFILAAIDGAMEKDK